MSSAWSTVLMMRPGRAEILAIGDNGPGALGGVVLTVVEVVTAATFWAVSVVAFAVV